MIVMLMNFETNYKYCFVHVFFHFVYFAVIFVLTTYSLKQDVIARQGYQANREGFLFHGSSSSGSRRSQLLGHVQPGDMSHVHYHIYLNFISNLFIYHTTCVILLEDSESVEDQGQS
jgi:hypothetical protein